MSDERNDAEKAKMKTSAAMMMIGAALIMAGLAIGQVLEIPVVTIACALVGLAFAAYGAYKLPRRKND